MLFRYFDLHLGIHFAGSKHQAYFLRAGFQFHTQIQLGCNGSHVAGTSHVGLRFFIGFNQLGNFETGNGIAYDRNIFGCIGHGLGRRRGNSADQVHFIIDKTLGNGLQVGLVGLCVLHVIFYVLAFHKTFLLHTFDEALAGIIQCLMLHQLNDTNIDNFCRIFLRGFRFFVTAAAASRKSHHGQHHAHSQNLFAFKKHDQKTFFH